MSDKDGNSEKEKEKEGQTHQGATIASGQLSTSPSEICGKCGQKDCRCGKQE